ncbi:hypothetical protein VTN96DRAFT_9673 [Rasamsonia emersonii]
MLLGREYRDLLGWFPGRRSLVPSVAGGAERSRWEGSTEGRNRQQEGLVEGSMWPASPSTGDLSGANQDAGLQLASSEQSRKNDRTANGRGKNAAAVAPQRTRGGASERRRRTLKAPANWPDRA